MGLLGKAHHGAAPAQTFDALTVDKRVLVTASRTIAIDNVSTVSVGPDVEHSPRIVWLALCLMCGGVAYAASPLGFGPMAGLIPAAAFAAAALLFLFLLMRPEDRRPYLIIGTTDGVLSRFTAGDHRVLEEVRRLLTDKINRGEEASAFSVDFGTGVIEPFVADAGAQAVTPAPAGGRVGHTGNGFAAGNGSQGRSSPAETTYGGASTSFASTSSGADPYLNGAVVADPQIDFSGMLPIIVDMHRFYSRQQGAEYLEKRLEELELLMRSGATTASQKTRIRELTRDLSQILHAYPQVVKVFSDIRAMTGP